MATGIAQQAQVARDSHQARRTEAMPKSTLFGSILELQTEEGAKSARELDLSSVKVPKTPTGKGAGQRFTLPEEVKKQLPGASVLEKSRREYETQRNLLTNNTSELKKREEESLYNLSRSGEPVFSARDSGTAKPQWFTDQDIKGAKEINIVGLNQNQSFNRDKYGQKAPVHNYSYIGDILRPGMDFPRRERTEIQMRNLGYGTGDMNGILAAESAPPQRANASARSPRKTAIAVPPNIKHQFGTRVCDKLLSDKDVVEKTIRDQKELKESIQRKSKPVIVPAFSKEMNPEYEMLSNAMRMNVTPGYTMNHKTSTTKTAFNDQVHLFRYQDPDKWRYQKDELSKWRECIFLQKMLAKGLDNILDNTPKFQRNWEDAPRDRTKTAPAPTTRERKPQPRAKPKTAPKTEQSKKASTPLEDFKFETPPVTPPPEKVQAVGNRKDSEFWSFYDKGGK
ncbi:uncharacterized protein LOC123562340 [Mercenaria mercenaria]|uniref:uncharacterized protein LOC123562340 n=1 Tax=Mercenaria mercenaria TaxID=6596 RepID=UPI00234F1B35|nr:uncharacterized protein LOC123562340 [Mercenaria mercenaria]